MVTSTPGADLLDRVHAQLKRFVVFPTDEAADAVALWIAATHAQPAWECAPRLQIRSPMKQCGKSRLLDMVEALCHDPLMMVFASPAALFRSIGDVEPVTLLVDETDTIFGGKDRTETQEAIRGILNAGHQRGRTIPRCVPPSMEVKHFPTFAMAALAGIGSLPDTIEDRSVIIGLHRKAPGETVEKLRWRLVKPGLHELRDLLHSWARSHLGELRDAYPPLPVDDRAADTWEPLAAIADAAGGHWPARARKACTKLCDAAAGSDVDTNLGIRLLADLRDIFSQHQPHIKAHTDALLSDLRKIDEAPWHDYFGHPFDSRDLAKLLRLYEVKSRTVNINGERKKGYYVADLWNVWQRYLPPMDGYSPSFSDADDASDEASEADQLPVSLGGADTSDTYDTMPPDLGEHGVGYETVNDTSGTEVSQVSQGVGEHLPSDLGSVAGVAGVATPKTDGSADAGEIVADSLRNVRCPSCRWRFQTAVQPGHTAWCKKCSHEFTVGTEKP